ncbi:unnamed protein product (macronuclear) [Paramecium tetraurelia]|uniref:non-specific serine/threonine protein kinase n=1 Tax=Paramecium tetraurelia TaxID=5888 RepID=A0EHX3_PARTE|nr:uncharacterized protein GSPATT00027241001 [Paramecium tetraurelia]CAK94914.1 unnamed protein product [Paramecium tetraurelia]|eukprot:XP_001462287.1 hypothetical protein (macronuclear) [Paramecium tetraurelia strain d4-2]
MSYPNIQEFLEDFEKENELLGKGTYGEVYKMKTKRIINPELERVLEGQEGFNGQQYAVKMMDAKTEKSFSTIQKEFLILKSLPKQHPNIIRLYKSYAWANQITKTYTLVLVMELADKSLMKEIEDRIQAKKYFTDDQLHNFFLQCIQTLNDIKLHSNIYHRDIKPENILLNKEQQLLISDFGVSRKLMKEKLPTINGTLVGTPAYLSPILWKAFEEGQFQVSKINKITHNVEKSDVYSLGVTLLQTTLLLNTEIQKLNSGEQGEQTTRELLRNVQNQRIKFILMRMLDHDEKQRASYNELLQLLNENIPKQIVQNKKPIFSYVEPKLGIKEQFSLQAKITFENNCKQDLHQNQQSPQQIDTQTDFDTVGQGQTNQQMEIEGKTKDQ